jgi:chemotaxis protein methyltransferase CheR
MASFLGISETKEIAAVLTNQTGYPISELSLSFLKRRLDVFFDKQGVKRIEHFYEKMKYLDFVQALILQLIIDTSELFRDPGFWRVLNSKILPEVLNTDGNIWIPDASSGEELYSLIILLLNSKSKINNKIHINTPSKQRTQEIMNGIIKSKDIELNVNNFKRLELQSKYEDFIDKDGRLVSQSFIMNNVVVSYNWFLTEPVQPNSISLILYRNSMLYVSKSLQERIFATIYNGLIPGGYLALGVKERIPELFNDKFEIVDNQEGIYRRKIWK